SSPADTRRTRDRPAPRARPARAGPARGLRDGDGAHRERDVPLHQGLPRDAAARLAGRYRSAGRPRAARRGAAGGHGRGRDLRRRPRIHPSARRARASPDLRADPTPRARERHVRGGRSGGGPLGDPRPRRGAPGHGGSPGDARGAVRARFPLRGPERGVRRWAPRVPGPGRELRAGAGPMIVSKDLRTHLRETALWYGGLGLLTVRVARNLTLPPSYFWLVAREIDIIGVRS